MNAAFVHDWLVTWRGGEKVLAALAELYPDAPIYTLFHDPKAMPEWLNRRRIIVHPLANRAKKLRKAMLPILPRLIESFDLRDFDLIISSSSCVAHGALKRKDAKHLSYLHSPMRYIWDQQQEYLDGVAHIPGAQWAIKAVTPAIRAWDVKSASPARVDRFVANSSFVADRARRYYGRDDTVVVPPPIELERFHPVARDAKGGYLFAAGAFVSYKRFDLAIRAAEALGRRLVIAGSGPMESALRRLAGPKTTFVISPDDRDFERLMREADAFLFPGVEDFGMIAVEAMASGTPVIALRQGGARDFMVEGVTGSFFDEPTVDSLKAALQRFEPGRFDPTALRRHAERYGKPEFQQRIRAEIARMIDPGARR